MFLHSLGWRSAAFLGLWVVVASGPLAVAAEGGVDVISRRQLDEERRRAEYGEKAREALVLEIETAKELLRDPDRLPDEELRSELLFRLAVSYEEMARYEWAKEMDRVEREIEACFDAGGDSCVVPPDLTVVEQNLTLALNRFQNLEANYRNFHRMDEVLFRMAVTYEQLEDDREARAVYRRLVERFPTSSYVPDAYLAIGEIYFEDGNAYRALQAYERAASIDSDIQAFALFKAGWCSYNLGEIDAAVEAMELVLTDHERRRERGEEIPISLEDDALQGLVTFLAEIGDLDGALIHLRRHGQQGAIRDLMWRLTQGYRDNGENELAVQTLRRLVTEEPMAPDNPEAQAQILDIRWELDEFAAAALELETLVHRYGPDGRWRLANADDVVALKEADQRVEKALRRTATEGFSLALKRKDRPLLEQSAALYEQYLQLYGDTQHAYEMRFWHAEALYKLKRYERASELYEQVVAADAGGKYLADAAANTIFAIEKVLATQGPAVEVAEGAVAPVELGEWQRRLVAACDTYVEVLPDDKRTNSVRYKGAEVYAVHNQFKEANRRYLEVIRADPESEMAESCVQDLLATYEAIEAWDELGRVAREFHANPAIGRTATFRGELLEIAMNAAVKSAETRAGLAAADDDAARFAEAADAYLAVYEEFGDAKIAPLALYNAGFYHARAGNPARSMALRQQFIATFPDVPGDAKQAERKLYQKTVAALGEHHDSIADFARAIPYYQLLYERDPTFAIEGFIHADMALQRAARYELAMGRLDDGVRDYRIWIDAHPDDEAVPGVLLRIADAYWKAEQHEAAAAAFVEVQGDERTAELDPEMVIYAHKMAGECLAALGRDGDARQTWDLGIQKYQRLAETNVDLKRASVDAAEMRFRLLEYEFAQFDGLSLAQDERSSRQDLRRKQAQMDELKQHYLHLASDKTAGPWAIASAYMAGRVVLDLFEDLMNAQCPASLSPDQCEHYQQSLKIVAMERYLIPVINAYREVLAAASRANIYNEYTMAARRTLSELSPEEFPPDVEQIPQPAFMTPVALPATHAR